jgi:hypothetical protein
VVPGKGGTPIRADTPVNMTFTVTAKERYLWTLELKRRGLSAISVLRRAMDELFEEEILGNYHQDDCSRQRWPSAGEVSEEVFSETQTYRADIQGRCMNAGLRD